MNLKNEKIKSKFHLSKADIIFDENSEFTNLFDNELVALEEEKDGSLKIGFLSSCMCGTPSILLKKDTMYLFNYCKDKLPPKSKEHYYSYNILKKYKTNNSFVVNLRNEKSELQLIFSKTENKLLYELEIIGKLPTGHVGVIDERISYWTFNADKFKKEDCGDFDG